LFCYLVVFIFRHLSSWSTFPRPIPNHTLRLICMNSFLLNSCVHLPHRLCPFLSLYNLSLSPRLLHGLVCALFNLLVYFDHLGNSANQMEHRTSRNPSKDGILISWMGSGLFKTLAWFLRLLVQMQYPEAGWRRLSKSECLTILCSPNQNSHGV